MSDLRAAIDSIEGRIAAFLVGGGQHPVAAPCGLPPTDAQPGAVLSIQIETDAAADDAKRPALEFIDRMSGGEN